MKCEECTFVSPASQKANFDKLVKDSASKKAQFCVKTPGDTFKFTVTDIDFVLKCGTAVPGGDTPGGDGDSAVYMKIASSMLGAAMVMHLV